MKLIITAGGQGTKFWPYSREAKPKQFQPIIKDKSLFQYTVETLVKSFNADDIYVSTKRRYLGTALEQVSEIPVKNYILEPDYKKNRGPAEGLVFVTMSINFPDEPLMLIQVDCIRTPEDAFLNMITATEKVVKRDKKFITGGIKATYPILGVDYMQLGDEIVSDDEMEFYKVDKFVPRTDDFYKTKKLIQDFHIVTHCNHTCWYPDLLLNDYKKYNPGWYKSLMEIKDVIGKRGEEKSIDEIYAQMESGPTEDVISHSMNEGYAILLPFKWVDFGTWDSMYEYFSEDNKVYSEGKVLSLDAEGNLVKIKNPEKLVAVVGVKNLVVVDTDDALLIIPRDRVSDVSGVVKKLDTEELREFI
ncbi:hypothetical protein A2415_05410 [candidate division WWE3 bacterium RIFOXYC1_FULL_39_7]|uniref:Nucleotidyl transferase domain-containing protein n=2 Tax=Katanobacteria TaxID=422282 RepID=A0A1F4X9S0_UNCKA|nr:MAG: hypothetical protein A2415_05410 [candidate division WWE3 bacterium RIFOXYC1_FULL_39_7]OGC78414.1 MAG: hypothetical protein A2619_00930 [candidate division WWE3 bacterium RIFOXYD1_FULL_39_9]